MDEIWEVEFYMPSWQITDCTDNKKIRIKDSKIVKLNMSYKELLLLELGIIFEKDALREHDNDTFYKIEYNSPVYSEYRVKSKFISFDTKCAKIFIEYLID